MFLLESENEKSSTQLKITARLKHVVVYKSIIITRTSSFKIQIFIVNVQNNKTAKRLC